MEIEEKVISLFKYIKELYSQRYNVIGDVHSQPWYKFVDEIPKDDENIKFNYMDRTEDIDTSEDIESDIVTLLRVKKPEFESCPVLPSSLDSWIEGDWQRYNIVITHKLKIVEYSGEEVIEILFADNNIRIRDYNDWTRKRNMWIQHQNRIEKTRNFFNELYHSYIELERDSETIEFMIGQGVLSCDSNSLGSIYHPILLKRVSIIFDSKNNVIEIIDSNINSEIYTMLLQGIDYINHSVVKGLQEDLSEKFYHPLDRNDTPDYLKSFAHKLHSDSKYIDDLTTSASFIDKVTIYNNPVFFIRKRTGGVIKSLEEIIQHISETGYIPGPILNLMGENIPQLAIPVDQLDISQSLAAISGEDKDILLSKEANREQLEIAKRIETFNSVLVQGPPGTGKTHTIANLIGHFLSQGKNILVTSHTKKALTVVKEKVVVQLQNLCVAVLDDNNKDMERSIDGITEYISSHTSLELEGNIEKLKEKRIKILDDLSEVRKNIFAIKYKEYKTIIIGGKEYSVAEAARFVFENKDELSYLPGKVLLYKPLPVSISDLELIYKTNELITIREDSELSYELPNPRDLVSPDEFELLVTKRSDLKRKLERLKDVLNKNIIVNEVRDTVTIKGEPFCSNFNDSKMETLRSLISSNSKQQYLEWQLNAILTGKNGGGFKTVWENFKSSIKDTYSYSSDIAPLIIGKKLTMNYKPTISTIDVLKEIRDHFKSGKKISNLTLFMHKEWKVIISEVKINNQEISSELDCEVLIMIIQLELKRQQVSDLWFELIEKHGGISFSEFGDTPEQSCISYLDQIGECLNWYHSTFETIKKEVLANGYNSMLLEDTNQYPNPIDEVRYHLDLIYTIFPMYISLVEIIYRDLPKINNEIEKTIRMLNSQNLVDSEICRNIIFTLKEKDTENYRKHFNVLDVLYQKYFYQFERNRILNEIELYAPEWASLIKSRVGIHGMNKIPLNIEDAWKWKQFTGIIDEITSQPFEELQHKSVLLNKGLRKVTSELAENLAWYHLIIRIDMDISKKLSLQGWKLTTKKIGKGTGKSAPRLKREAQKLMAKCQSAVPVWIMPINKALESLDPAYNKFDIVIIDEASQSDISALAIMYLAKKIIIVGDDEQVSPSAVGVNVDRMMGLADMHIKDIVPNSHLYDMKSSLYDIAKMTFPTLMLKEHFRCVPSIIGYSNRLSYDFKIKPLRDDSSVIVKPSTIAYRVDGERDGRKRNMVEAKSIVALMLACMEHPNYNGMTFGVISLLGDEQAKIINQLAIEKINPQEYEKRKILCGNASHFQGDERDVIFISLVDSNEGEGPLRMTGDGIGNSTKQRYNVAASRAKDQLWVIHSLDVNNDLKSGDMRKNLIEYVTNPTAFEEQLNKIIVNADSPFEISVASSLVRLGYHIIQQWVVGSYRIDMVAVCGDKKIAIECDGELYHSGYEKIREDMERQAVMERLGWRFIRIRGSEYYRNPNETINRVISELTAYEIHPEQNIVITDSQNTELKDQVIIRATHILDEWEQTED